MTRHRDHTFHTRRLLAAAALLLTASCGGGAQESPSTPVPTTTDGPSPSSADTTSPPTGEPSPAETTPAPTPVEPTQPTDIATFSGAGFPPVASDSGAHGSGCAPGPGSLPDGTWFGFAHGLTETEVEFDLACFLTGEAATAEAAARGLEAPPPNDYLIVNDNPSLRTVPVAGDARAWVLDPGVELVETTWVDFLGDAGEFQACPGESCLLWLYINGGEMTEVVSQYVP